MRAHGVHAAAPAAGDLAVIPTQHGSDDEHADDVDDGGEGPMQQQHADGDVEQQHEQQHSNRVIVWDDTEAWPQEELLFWAVIVRTTENWNDRYLQISSDVATAVPIVQLWQKKEMRGHFWRWLARLLATSTHIY